MDARYSQEEQMPGISCVVVCDDAGQEVAHFRFGYDRDRFGGRGDFGELIFFQEVLRSEVEDALDYLLDWRQWLTVA